MVVVVVWVVVVVVMMECSVKFIGAATGVNGWRSSIVNESLNSAAVENVSPWSDVLAASSEASQREVARGDDLRTQY
ncbi:hypothetical protein E2C01_094459 [Portunus trituberculatus]|uniref:Secreted protein n=1 Tax=Portunus trituberculatus TaxID=210409 RepID=A0A5B7K3A7_PORTR|nr:hypothetical protein [Portunus trituberculatus]